MADVQVRETVSGFRFRGRWEAVANKGEELSQVITEDASREDVQDWEAWRPREDESENDVREKTVKQACIEENPVEAAGDSAAAPASTAVEDMEDAVEEAANGNTETAAEKGQRAAQNMVLSVDTLFRKAFRRIEAALYHHVVARTNPYYFDGKTVSASLQRKRSVTIPRNKKEKEYTMSVEIHDDDVLTRCRDELATT